MIETSIKRLLSKKFVDTSEYKKDCYQQYAFDRSEYQKDHYQHSASDRNECQKDYYQQHADDRNEYQKVTDRNSMLIETSIKKNNMSNKYADDRIYYRKSYNQQHVELKTQYRNKCYQKTSRNQENIRLNS